MEKQRNFIQKDLQISTWSDIEPYLEDLKKREISSSEELLKWWKDRSEAEAFIEEDMAWRYIKMSCDTENTEKADNFNFFVTEIEPKVSEYSDILDNKFVACKFVEQLDKAKYFVPLRAIKSKIEIFRKENIPLFAELQQKERLYGSIASKMTVTYNGEEMTLQKAGNLLKEIDRNVRKEVYELINNRRIQDSEELNNLLSELIKKRQQVAVNAGFENYRDYKFSDLKRFDYSIKDCFDFHEAIKNCVCPIIEKIDANRVQKLGLEVIMPYDTEVDIDLKPPVKPFETSEELLNKSIEIFHKVRPQYGNYLQIMKDGGFLDLEARKGKAPGGYNYPLYESNIPFIFTNATGNLRDIETLMHEGGHAIHSFLSSNLEIIDFKNLPSEVAELASMSMELISMEHWQVFFDTESELKKAKKHQLEGVIKVLPWIAIVDRFQHLLYENPDHTIEQRYDMWKQTTQMFASPYMDKNSYPDFYKNTWQKQLHIFEVPFYYIEYGIAQLGAIAIWRNYKKNPEKALNDYENALKLGYSKTIPEIYKTAGIEFNFSKEYIGELMDFVNEELNKL